MDLEYECKYVVLPQSHVHINDNIDPEAFFDDMTADGENTCGDISNPVDYYDSLD